MSDLGRTVVGSEVLRPGMPGGLIVDDGAPSTEPPLGGLAHLVCRAEQH